MWSPVERVVQESLSSLNSNRIVCVPGMINKCLYFLNLHPIFSAWFQEIALRLSGRDQLPVPLSVYEEQKEHHLIDMRAS